VPPSLRISPLALNETDQKVLSVAASLLTADGMPCTLLEEGDPGGHLLIIDGDTEAGRRILAQTSDNQLKLLFASQAETGRNLVHLPRPIRVAELQDVLTRIHLRLRALLASKGEPASKPNTAPAAITANAKNLLHIFLEAKQSQCCYAIEGPDRSRVLIGGHNATVAANGAEAIGRILKQPLAQLEVEEIDIVEFAKRAQQMTLSALDTVVWQVGIACSKGELLAGHDLEQPVKLKAWPNFTRNGFHQLHFKLAAIMARQPISLLELKKISGIPLEEIVNFYNAAVAVGLIERDTQPAARHRATRIPGPRQHRLLGLLARKLGFA
jgi:hypothetical protein